MGVFLCTESSKNYVTDGGGDDFVTYSYAYFEGVILWNSYKTADTKFENLKQPYLVSLVRYVQKEKYRCDSLPKVFVIIWW